MSRFLATLLESAARSSHGMVTGEPREPVRHSWAEVHDRARAMVAALRADDDGHPGLPRGAAVGVLAGRARCDRPALPGRVALRRQRDHAPPAHDAHRPRRVAEDTVSVLKMIDAALVVLGPPFDALAPILTEHGIPFRSIDSLDGDGATVRADEDAAGEGDTALLQLTSGSTAEPKAVRITHANLHANITAMAQASRLDVDRDVQVSWLPLFHDMGMVGFLTVPMTLGLDLVTVTPLDFLARPIMWAELISKYHGTVTAAPNFAYAVLGRQLARFDGSLDLSSLRIALNGAEPIDPDAVGMLVDAGARFGLRPEAVLCAYGMAETALGVAFAPVETGLAVDEIDADDLETRRLATPGTGRSFPKLGPPLPGIAVRVIGDHGAVLGEREVGVLQLRGPSVTPGYLTVNGPVAAQDAEGWFDTGDEGYVVDGQVVVCGRRKDVIIMGGRNIYPTDIERAAGTADGVRAGNAVAVRLAAGEGRHRESFAVVVESRKAGDPEAESGIGKDVTSRWCRRWGCVPRRWWCWRRQPPQDALGQAAPHGHRRAPPGVIAAIGT